MIITVVVTEPEGERADLALLKTLSSELGKTGGQAPSRRMLKACFAAGAVRVVLPNHGGHRRLEPAERLAPGQVTIELSGELPGELGDELLGGHARVATPSSRGAFLPIVYEDERLLVLHKQSGVPSAPHSATDCEGTAVGAALAHTPSLPRIPGHELEPGLLHRLDNQTSGLLVFAKTAAEWQRLREAWRAGQRVRKFYRAIVTSEGQGEVRAEGHDEISGDARGRTESETGAKTPSGAPSEPTFPRVPFRIDLPLAHDAKSAKRMLAISSPETLRRIRGKPLLALTHVLEATPLGRGDGTRKAGARENQNAQSAHDLLIRIETGVMHQIRCHLASTGWPILGDPLYGTKESALRLWLHAWKLELPLENGVVLSLEAHLPHDWPGNSTFVAR